MVTPLAAAGGAQDALVTLFVVLLAAELGEEACRRAGQSPIIGEIVAGVLIGPSVLGLVEPDEVLWVRALRSRPCRSRPTPRGHEPRRRDRGTHVA